MTRDGVRARDLVVVPLATAHLDQVLAIEAQVATTGWSRRIFERELAEHTSRCYLAAVRPTLVEPVVVGYAGMQVLIDEAHLTTIAVADHARRRGVATRLLVELLREARARGVASATLEVRIDNAAARALYATFGFRPVGVRPRYYDGAVDALILWAHDIGGAELGRLLRARDPLMGEGERQRAGGRGSRGEGERQRAGGRGSRGEGERQRAGGRRAERGA